MLCVWVMSASLSIMLWILSWFFSNMIGYFTVVVWQLLVTGWCHWHVSGLPSWLQAHTWRHCCWGTRRERQPPCLLDAGACLRPPSWLRVLGKSVSPFRTLVFLSPGGHRSEPHLRCAYEAGMWKARDVWALALGQGRQCGRGAPGFGVWASQGLPQASCCLSHFS